MKASPHFSKPFFSYKAKAAGLVLLTNILIPSNLFSLAFLMMFLRIVVPISCFCNAGITPILASSQGAFNAHSKCPNSSNSPIDATAIILPSFFRIYNDLLSFCCFSTWIIQGPSTSWSTYQTVIYINYLWSVIIICFNN